MPANAGLVHRQGFGWVQGRVCRVRVFWEDVQHMLLQASLFAAPGEACIRHSPGWFKAHTVLMIMPTQDAGLKVSCDQWVELLAVLLVCGDARVPVYTCAVCF
jgi:hypothetical protein